MLHAQRAGELERVAEHGGVGRRQRPRLLRGSQARRRGRGAHAGRQPGPAGESLDRQQTAALDVQHPLALAAVLEHEVAEEAGGRALGERRGGEAVEDVLAVRRPGERRRQALGNGRRPPRLFTEISTRSSRNQPKALNLPLPTPSTASVTCCM